MSFGFPASTLLVHQICLDETTVIFLKGMQQVPVNATLITLYLFSKIFLCEKKHEQIRT